MPTASLSTPEEVQAVALTLSRFKRFLFTTRLKAVSRLIEPIMPMLDTPTKRGDARKLDFGLIRRMLGHRTLRFVIVGGGAALSFLLMCWAFVAAGISAFPAAVLAYAIAFAGAYLLQRNWTFRVQHNHGRSLPRYLAVQAICACLAGAGAHISAQWLGSTPAVTAMVATVLSGGASYILSSRWAFA